MWPYEVDEAIGTWTKGRRWGYEYQRVVFADIEEAAVAVAGHESFHFLRHSRQVPGRNTEPSANRYGIAWLEEFRTWRQMPETPVQLELF
jgi:hypothetical protein